jgi:hypothetical protein
VVVNRQPLKIKRVFNNVAVGDICTKLLSLDIMLLILISSAESHEIRTPNNLGFAALVIRVLS